MSVATYRSMRCLSALVLVGALMTACASGGDESAGLDDTTTAADGNTTDALRVGYSQKIKLNFEGSCEFLRDCSTWSRNPPQPDEVQWGCEGWQVCSNSDHFLAAPSKIVLNGKSIRPCGLTVRICRSPDNCTDAVVRDISDHAVWEGSPGLLEDLGMSWGFTGRCAGYGGGTVTMTPTGSN